MTALLTIHCPVRQARSQPASDATGSTWLPHHTPAVKAVKACSQHMNGTERNSNVPTGIRELQRAQPHWNTSVQNASNTDRLVLLQPVNMKYIRDRSTAGSTC